MKISKSRLLQIIREEVELREKYVEENTYELDENIMVELGDQNEDGKISTSEFNDEIDQDQRQQGLSEIDLEEKDSLKGLKKLYKKAKHAGKSGFNAVEKAVSDTASDPAAVAGRVRADIKGFKKEDKLFNPHSKKPVPDPRNKNKLK